jgi:hypothetical protein
VFDSQGAVGLYHPDVGSSWPVVRFLADSRATLRRAISLVTAAEEPHGCALRPGRVEQKYCVPDDIARHTLRVASAFLSRDRHASREQTQRVTSLYFDSPALTFLRWHREQLPTRFKLRVRAYGDGQYECCFAEVKQKVDGCVRKRRARLPAGTLERLIEADPTLSDTIAGADAAALREFLWQMLMFRATPKVLVSCDRESLRGDVPGDETAVTVDRGLVCQPARNLRGEAGGWRPIPLPLVSSPVPVLLELKYGALAPAWMAGLVHQLAPWRVSFSKYMTAMTRLSEWEMR